MAGTHPRGEAIVSATRQRLQSRHWLGLANVLAWGVLWALKAWLA